MTVALTMVKIPPRTETGISEKTKAMTLGKTPRMKSQMAAEMPEKRDAMRVMYVTEFVCGTGTTGRPVAKTAKREMTPVTISPP